MNANAIIPTDAGAPPATVNPAAAYIESLTTDAGKRGQVTALRMVAAALGMELHAIDWSTLSAPGVRAIMARIPGAPATRNKVLSALKGVARMAAELHLISNEERAAIEGIRGDKGKRLPAGRDVTGGEIAELMRVCANDPTPAGARDAAMVAMMRATGLRRAEVCALTLATTDAAAGELRIIGKGNKERKVFITNGALSALRDWLELRGDDGTHVFTQIGKGGRIHHASQLTPQAVNLMLEKRIAQAGIDALTAHDFRRTLAGDLLDAGNDIATVAAILGHSSVTTTQRYDRRGDHAQKRAAAGVSVPYFRRTLAGK